MSILYSCSHLDTPHAPLPPSYPSSSSHYHPLERLYFCEECDAVRCDLCVAVEIASYFCPNCLFDVPSANVRADKNRCARSCFSCPTCESSLSIQASDQPSPENQLGSSSSGTSSQPGPPYSLVCSSCKWSSKEIGWNFEKPTGIALQLQRMNTQADLVQSEFDSLKDHLESYISLSTPTPSAPSSSRSNRNPSRHISQLTQMAQKALHRDVGGLSAYSARSKRPSAGKDEGKERYGWDELGEYEPKDSWRRSGIENGLNDVEFMRQLEDSGANGIADVKKVWGNSHEGSRMAKSVQPQRIPLQTKLTKRCAHPNCRHLLIQPDTKSVRMKIKMVASNYLPLVEIGRRRRRLPNSDIAELPEQSSSEDIERRRRERRRTRGGIPLWEEEDETMDIPLKAGEIYSFQISLTNPLYDPIQIRLTPSHQPKKAPTPKFNLIIPTPHFTINALKDAWAYDDEEYDEDDHDGNSLFMGGGGTASEAGFSEEGTTTTGTTALTSGTATGTGTLSRKSRLSILSSNKKLSSKEKEVEKKGNTSKVNLEIELLPDILPNTKIEFDLEIRYTYKADDFSTLVDKDDTSIQSKDRKKEEGGGGGRSKEEYKNFTFWVRVNLGKVE